MYALRPPPNPRDGLGIAPLLIPLIASLVGGAGSVVASRVIGAGGPEPLSYQETLAAQAAEDKKRREIIMLVAGGAVFLVFVVAALRR